MSADTICPHCGIDWPQHEQACVLVGGTLDLASARDVAPDRLLVGACGEHRPVQFYPPLESADCDAYRNRAVVAPCGSCGEDAYLADLNDFGHCRRCGRRPPLTAKVMRGLNRMRAVVSAMDDEGDIAYGGPIEDVNAALTWISRTVAWRKRREGTP